ncbi:MAG: single-stranded-DNA-specific exonuclease RecJ [Lachnospiraceae bacterium]|nr:single-stranded-DNA-specific exonuclease RecJ [Lachnospiraceae bacterium]MDY4617852.1 single-stranded-DNA-specific exonuclease RecJ [Lachnospiraceae bacterium]
MEQWLEIRKSGRFDEIGKKYGIDPVVARIMRNRDVTEDGEIESYLNGTTASMGNPWLLKDAKEGAELLREKIQEKKKIRIIGDYDIDGVMSTYILLQAIRELGGVVDVEIPDRIKDGYGVNEQLVEQAVADGVDTILTCDNGIAAKKELEAAKDAGLTVIITDHHEIPYQEEEQERIYLIPKVDAVIDPKQEECTYPYKGICGAVVAWKLIQVLYETMGRDRQEADKFLEYAAFATVGDVMELRGENRILVKEGLKRLNQTENMGLKALIFRNQLQNREIKAYHIGFVLGPCLNASGRLDTARKALKLLCAENWQEAVSLAEDLTGLNEIRKDMTQKGVEEAVNQIEQSPWKQDKVYVVYLPECHESIAGIIAGRIREKYHRPVFVLTKAAEGVKGSGRSIEAYSMYEELCKCQELLDKFGGHPMAAGLSMQEEHIEEFRQMLNRNSVLEDGDIEPVIRFDAVLQLKDWTEERVLQLEKLEPFGNGNEKPIFAAKNLRAQHIRQVGKEGQMQKMILMDKDGTKCEAISFENHNISEGEEFRILYYPQINSYGGYETIQLVISGICR